ncbi:hypothetical protein H0H92_000234 [Tricholoma furcatifolium]|nr:hypothetical protein H0H92_000234 [Tricholoma furcatifolium]
MQHFGKSALRVAKNYTKGYSETQAKVRDATSNDPWGPSGTQMNEIAQLTYNQNDFVEIMEMLDKRLNDKGKNWRHVFKSLTLLDYCLHQGSENVVIYFRDNAYIIKTLKEFQYVDEEGKDQGANVRQKAKDITNLLMDEARLREERRARASMRDRMIRGGPTDDDEYADENRARRRGGRNDVPVGQLAGKRPNRDEEELRKAIEESKKSLAAEQASAEERDFQRAIKLSEEEEAKRKNQVEDSNAAALFDDQNQLPPPTNATFSFSDPTPYATGLQPQFTSLQPQFTSFNPYQQQAEQEAQQAEWMRQQQLFLQQQQQAQLQAQQQAQQEEWMRQQQMLQLQQQQAQQQQNNLFAQQLAPQPTGFGSNNPFAPSPTPTPSFSPPQPQPPSFNLGGTYDSHSTAGLSSLSASSPSSPPSISLSPSPNPSSTNPYAQQQKPFQVKPRANENEALANLFANRDDGQDTFGNVGTLRYGHTDAGRAVVATQKTGNPFAQQQQQQQFGGSSNERPFFDI